jgi:hypothetical protein
VYVSWKGVNVSAYFTGEVGIENNVADVDVTTGAGTDYKVSAAGLITSTVKLSLAYEVTAWIGTIAPLLQVGDTGTLIYGPEGNASGKPKHEQSMMLQKISGPKNTIGKDKVTVELEFVSVAAPTTTIMGTLAGTF